MTFPADGVTLNFLGCQNWCVSRPYSVILSPDQSGGPMSHPASTVRYYPVEKKIEAGLASDKEGQCKHPHDFATVHSLTF